MGIQTFPPSQGAGGGLKYEVLGSINLATGTPTAVAFTGIDPKYRSLKIVVDAVFSESSRIRLRLNNDSGNNYTNGVRSLGSSTWNTVQSTNTDQIATTTGSSTRHILVAYIDDTNIPAFKSVYGSSVTAVVNTIENTIYTSTSTINEVNLFVNLGTFTGGTAYLLGSE
jgi:hypothetical protein